MFSTFAIFVLFASVCGICVIELWSFSGFGWERKGKTSKQTSQELFGNIYVTDETGKIKLDEDEHRMIDWDNVAKKRLPLLAKACFSLLVINPLSFLITFVVEPIFAITAITRSIGNVYFAYAVLVILVIQLIKMCFDIKKLILDSVKSVNDSIPMPGDEKYNNANPAQKKEYDALLAAREAELEKTVPVTNATLIHTTIRHLFFALPDLYLVYLLVLALLPK
jgi:hypothetical protein